MRYKIQDDRDIFGKECYEVVDTIGSDTTAVFDDLSDATNHLAKLNGIEGGVLWNGSSSEHGTDRFELEELIAIASNVESDIDTLIDKIDRHSPQPIEIKEILKSIKNLHSLRYVRLMDYFIDMVEKGYIKDSDE